MDKLIPQLKGDFPMINFMSGKSFLWRADQNTVVFTNNLSASSDKWILLHEVAHALLGHRTSSSDFELLLQEVEAWDKAVELSATYNLKINNNYIEDCLDTYRDWLYARSSCPNCSSASLQVDTEPVYLCHNCDKSWRVSQAKFCRPYRQTAGISMPIDA